MSKSDVKKLAEEAKKIITKLEAVKPLYSKLDELTLALKKEDLSEFKLQVVDNFAEKNVVFRPVGVKRFEIKRVANE